MISCKAVIGFVVFLFRCKNGSWLKLNILYVEIIDPNFRLSDIKHNLISLQTLRSSKALLKDKTTKSNLVNRIKMIQVILLIHSSNQLISI